MGISFLGLEGLRIPGLEKVSIYYHFVVVVLLFLFGVFNVFLVCFPIFCFSPDFFF